MRVFKGKWTQLRLDMIVAIIVGIALVVWKGWEIIGFAAIFAILYLTYRVVLGGAAIKTVTVHSDGLEIVPAFPWFKARRWQIQELAT